MRAIYCLAFIVLTNGCSTLDQSFRLGATTGALAGAVTTYGAESAAGRQPTLESVGIGLSQMWGIDARLIVGPHHSPVFGVDIAKKEQEKLPEILTHEQIRKLLLEAKLRQHEWYPIWAVTVLTGCRNGEVFGLRHEDIELVS